MVKIGKITGETIAVNKNGSGSRRLLQVEITGPDDIQTVEQLSSPGEDANPPLESRVFILEQEDSWKVAVAVDDGITPSMNAGEKKIYSISGGAISAFINLLNTGIIEINGNADFAVAYTDLKVAFDELKSDLNTFITTIYNTHNHPTAPSGPVSVPSATGTASTADMSGAKVDEVKLP